MLGREMTPVTVVVSEIVVVVLVPRMGGQN
jgi:hypothetical protein